MTIIVSSGQVSSGLSLSNDTLTVLSGGTTISAVLSQATEILSAGASASATNASYEAGITVSSGAELASAVIDTYSRLDVLSGGTAGFTQVDDASLLNVQAGGIEAYGFIAGTETVFGGTYLETISGVGALQVIESAGSAVFTDLGDHAWQQVISGGRASYTTASATTYLAVSAGGIAKMPSVLSGAAVFDIGGTLSAPTISAGGAMVIANGGQVISANALEGAILLSSGVALFSQGGGTFVSSAPSVSGGSVGQGGFEIVLSGGIAVGVTISGINGADNRAYQYVVSGGQASGTIIEANAVLEANGGTASGAIVSSGGTVYVFNSGLAVSTTVNSQGYLTLSGGGVVSSSQINSGGHEYVRSGGTDSGAQVNSGGNLYVYSGGLAGGATINNGGFLTVSSGGAEVSGTVASGGAIGLVNGTAQSFADTIQAVGREYVYSGATASGTVVSGFLYVSSGGTAVSATADQGGIVTVTGVGAATIGDTVQSGGVEYVFSGAVASNTLVSGYLGVSSGGESVSATIVQNGTVTVSGIGALTVADTVLSGGNEYVYSGAVASGAQVSGFMAVSGGGESVSAMVGNSGTLVVGQSIPSTGIVIPTGVLVATQAIDSSSVINSGGTLVISNLGLGLNETVGAFATAYVYSGGVASGTNIGSSGVMNVSSGGMAISANAASGGVLNVGGTGALTSNAMISAGGREYVYSAGVASGSVVQGYEYVSAGGEAMFTTVGSGGMVAVEQTGASTVNATLLSGGTEYVYSAGLASATTVSAGGNLLIEPFGASLGATDAGREVVFGGVASNTTVLSGGVLSAGRAGAVGNEVISTGVDILASGTVVSAVISAGGTEYINADGIGRATTVLGGAAVYVNGEFLIGTVGVVIPTGTPGPILLPAGVTIGDLLASGGIEYVASGATASLTTVSSGGDLVVNSGGTIAGTALQSGGTIDVTSLTYTSGGFFTFNSGTDLLTVTMGGNSFTETLTGSYTSASFSIVNDGDGGTDIVACYAAGTRIATPDGETAVEELCEGDLVRTASGEARKVRWLGHRQVDCTRHPNPDAILPVRIAAHAFGPALPARDLYVSPDHAIFLDGVLIPAGLLANGTTIRQIARASVTYFHVELDLHDVILAEGLPAESYLDTGNRAHFANGGAATTLHATFTAASWDGACAELVLHGPRLDAVRARLAARAADEDARASG